MIKTTVSENTVYVYPLLEYDNYLHLRRAVPLQLGGLQGVRGFKDDLPVTSSSKHCHRVYSWVPDKGAHTTHMQVSN